jgi:hypothetical protein
MANNRPNSFVIDLNNVTKKLNSQTVHLFVLEKLNLQPDEVIAFQINYQKKLVFIELRTNEQAIQVVNNYNLKCSINFENVDFFVKLLVVDGGDDVKLHDLPPQMTKSVILQKMREYGEILSFTEETWGEGYAFKNIANGVRIVRMKLKKSIPSYITIAGETTYVTYRNQTITCKWCGERLHYGKSCAENRMTQTGSANERLRSYAEATKQNNENTALPVNNTNVVINSNNEMNNNTENHSNSTTTTSKNNTNNSTNNSQNNDTQQNNENFQNSIPDTNNQLASTSKFAPLSSTNEKSKTDTTESVKSIFWRKPDANKRLASPIETNTEEEEDEYDEVDGDEEEEEEDVDMSTGNDEPMDANKKFNHEKNNHNNIAHLFKKDLSAKKVEKGGKKPKRNLRPRNK